ncbi:MAG TPA: adenylate/guanylate cyclase domain-containing protein [Gaiellaceae bacterium]|nr:adenylate/guanylate cyclase domain-containing protein [Gaiellaceae bacterium]
MVSAAATRKTVSVLFCDLADSTALGERLDPEPLRELLGRWYDEMRVAVERHGGTVEKFVGDAVMAIFGVPRAHEDDALRAIRAAVEMQSAVKRLNGGRDAPELRIRVGINTGEVVTGDDVATLATGDAVNTAKRLEEAAGAGEILIGAVTERLVRHAALLEAVEPVEAKGKSSPLPAWRVVHAVPDAEPFARRWDTPLVGRSRELAILRDELAASAGSRTCRLVTVLGEAGVGKTRLVSELVTELSEFANTVSGRCLPYGDGITFWPVAELIRTLGGDAAIAAAARPEPDGALIVERLRALGGGGGPAEELFWAVRRLFEALARERPLIVVLEDLHWAEPTLLDLVEHVSRWSRGAPILLLALARPELLEERPRWEGTLLRLDSLSPEEASQLLEALDDDGLLSPQTRARVTETAQGNPLYAEQLVAMISEAGTETAATDLPPTIQALLAARLDHIDPAERDVLERAAVVGREFWPGAVAALGESPGEAVGTTLLELVRLDFVEPAPPTVPGEDGFRFRHALIRDAAYGSTPLRRRAGHHERFARWLASVDDANEYDEIRGYHLEQAVLLSRELGSEHATHAALAAEARELLSDAGVRAYARGDAPAARNLLSRALALGKDGPADDLELRRILAGALWATGETEAALDLVEEVAAAAAAAGDRAEEWYARLDAAGMRGAGAPDGLVSFLETAFRAVEVFSELDDERGLAQAWRRISRAEIVRCSYAAAETAAARGLHYAVECGEKIDAAWAADSLGTALLWGPTPVPDGVRRCNELIAEFGGNEMLRANVLSALAGLRALEGDVVAARRLCAEAESIYRDLGQRMAIAGLTQVAAQIERLAENPAAAEAELRAGLEILQGTGNEAFQQGWLAAALIAQGRFEEAREPAEAARSIASAGDVLDQVVWRGVLARIEAVAGNLDEALSLARDAVDRASLTDGLTMQADALLDLSAVLEAAGDAEEAAGSASKAAALYLRKGAVARTSLTL